MIYIEWVLFKSLNKESLESDDVDLSDIYTVLNYTTIFLLCNKTYISCENHSGAHSLLRLSHILSLPGDICSWRWRDGSIIKVSKHVEHLYCFEHIKHSTDVSRCLLKLPGLENHARKTGNLSWPTSLHHNMFNHTTNTNTNTNTNMSMPQS